MPETPSVAFGPATLAFLADLRDHNEKAWFDANRERYERDYLAPGRAFQAGVEAGTGLVGKMMRIFRDTRFSKDKSPYKPHLDTWYTSAPDGWGPGLFCRLEAGTFLVGVGCHDFDGPTVARFRTGVVADGARLRAAVGEATVRGATLKRMPKGFPEDPYMLHTAFYVESTGPVPADPVGYTLAAWQRWKPVQAWLHDHVVATR
jgi:uncharacterized protein (TIGR02453 family)